jgi:hypothetical protein
VRTLGKTNPLNDDGSKVGYAHNPRGAAFDEQRPYMWMDVGRVLAARRVTDYANILFFISVKNE